MRRIITKIVYTLSMALILGCSDSDKGITPADISDITAEAGPGQIVLKWTKPEDGNIFYTKVSYYDYLEKKAMWRLSTSNDIVIPNTRAKFGEYEFTLETFSKSDNASGNKHIIKAVSGIAPATEKRDLLNLKEAYLSTNAQEPSEGPIKNLLDGNTTTFFHTRWSSPVPPAPHWIEIDLTWKEPMTTFAFSYSPRNNGNNKPTDFDIMGSIDGKEWFLIRNFTKEKDNLPVTATDSFNSETIKSDKPFTYLRLSVNKTNSNSIFWTMSVFKLFDIDIYDPEAPEEE